MWSVARHAKLFALHGVCSYSFALSLSFPDGVVCPGYHILLLCVAGLASSTAQRAPKPSPSLLELLLSMTVTIRPRSLFPFVWFLLSLANVIFASPLPRSSHYVHSRQVLSTRARSGIIVNDAAGRVIVFNSQTQQVIPQGSASDGGGSGFDATAVLWIVISFLLGVPLAVAGIRGWRLTIGTAIGLSIAVCSKYPLSVNYHIYCPALIRFRLGCLC